MTTKIKKHKARAIYAKRNLLRALKFYELESFRALKLSELENFRALKFSRLENCMTLMYHGQIGVF